MAAKNKYEILIDFLIDLTMDHGKVNELAKKVQAEFEKSSPELNIDSDKIKKAVSMIAGSFDDVDKAIQEIEKHVDAIDFDVADKSLDDFEKQLKGLENLDLDLLEKALGDMPDDELKRLEDVMGEAFNPENVSKLGDELKGLGTEFDKTTQEIEQMVLAEKKNLAAMKEAGLEGTDAYKKLEKQINEAEQELKGLDKTAEGAKGTFKGFSEGVKESFTGAFAGFGAFRLLESGLENIKQFFGESIKAAQGFESGMAEVSAITGVSGTALDEMGESARQLALRFGGEATDQLNSFKGILSKLGPQIAEQPAALDSMTNSINILAKAGGIDATSSMEALANTLLQFGVDLSDPMNAANEMERAMNVMAAGAKFGASEIPQISEAVIAAGVAASGANQSIEDVNAQIQILATGGKFGSEAGNALRNVYGLMIKGSGEAKTAFKQLGTSQEEVAKTLVDPSKGMAGALQLMKDGFDKIQEPEKRAAILSTIFGVENAAAAGIMLKNIEALKQMKTNITGTNTAYEQAAIIQETFGERMERAKAKLADIGMTIGQAILPVFGFLADHMELAIPIIAALVLGIGALVAPLVASAAATIALNLAFLASPIGVVALGLVALTTAYMAFHQSSIEVAEGYENEADASLKLAQRNIELNKSQQNLAKSNIDLAKEYFNLGNKTNRTAEEEQRFIELHKQLTKAYPGVLGPAEKFRENQEALTKTMGLGNIETDKATAANAKLISRYEELGNKTNRTVAENKEFKKIQGELNKIFPDVIGNTKDWSSELNLLKEKAGLTSGELIALQNSMNGLNEEMKKATDNKFVAQMNTATAKARDLAEKLNSIVEQALTKGMTGHAGDALAKEFQKLVNKVYGTFDVSEIDKIGNQFFNLLYGSDSGFRKAIAEEGAGDELEKFYTQILELQKQRAAAFGKIKIEPPEVVTPTPTPDGGAGGIGDKGKTKTAKTLYEIAKEKYDIDVKDIAINKDELDINAEKIRLAENRNKTTWDEYFAHQNILDSLEEEKAKLEELSKVKLTDAEIEKGIGKDLDDQLKQIQNKIDAEKNKGVEISVKLGVDENELLNAKRAFELKDLEFRIKMGLAKPEDMLPLLEKDLEEVRAKLNDKSKKLNDKEIIELQTQELEALSALNTKKEELVQMSLDKVKDKFDKYNQELESKNQQLISKLQEQNAIYFGTINSIGDDKLSKELQNIDKHEEAKLKKYEDWKELGIISDRQFEKAKTDIADEFAAKRKEAQEKAESDKMVMAEFQRAMEVEVNRAAEFEKLTTTQSSLQQQLAIYDAMSGPKTEAQQKEYDELKKRLDETNTLIETKGTDIGVIASELGTIANQGLLEGIAGDPEATKKALKKSMAFLAGYLEKKVSAFIIDWLLTPGVTGTFSFLPLPLQAPAFALAATAISAIVHKIAGPVLSKITSFAGGGRFDVPTAIVGDAKLAGSAVNTEWVFRDADVMAIATVASTYGNANIVNAINQLRNDFASQQLYVDMNFDEMRIGLRRADYMQRQTMR